MSLTHKFLNIALPLLTFILLSIFMIPLLFFKLIRYVKKLVCVENLARKVVIITGSASGIGEQLAYEYAKKGAVLSLVDIRDDQLVKVAGKARSLGCPEVITIGADVSKVEDCKRFVDETVNHFGKLDHLVNNAGIGGRDGGKKVEDWSDISMQYPIMEVNFWGVVYGTLSAIPHLKKSRGKIVVIASACGWYPLPRISIYNASKAAVINFFETLRSELGWAIGITIVTPGFIKTELAKRAIASEASLGIIPMESADECAKAIVKGVCRGDMYVTNPSWVKLGFALRVIIPEIVDFVHRLVFKIPTNNNTSECKEEMHLLKNSQPKAE